MWARIRPPDANVGAVTEAHRVQCTLPQRISKKSVELTDEIGLTVRGVVLEDNAGCGIGLGNLNIGRGDVVDKSEKALDLVRRGTRIRESRNQCILCRSNVLVVCTDV